MSEIGGWDVKFITAIFGIFGILLTTVISSVAYFYKAKVETKKSARKVLYFLLEIRYVIINTLFDPNKVAQNYLEHLRVMGKSKGLPIESSVFEGEIKSMIANYFQSLASSMKPDIEEKLLAPYEAALLEFSTVNPVLAYSLKGKEKLEAFISQTKSYRKLYESDVIDSIEQGWLKDFMFSSSDVVNQNANEQLIKMIDEDITLLAKHCGHRDYRDCKKVLKMKTIDFKESDYLEVDAVIDLVFKQLVEVADLSSKKTATV
ncbi:hypothetical protein L9G16_09860 [Shewanella sp. A25]|nr:hypothetical protein [Shewanella shenzhenensis]